MIRRAWCVGIAGCALLTVATACFAADQPATADTVAQAPAPAAVERSGKGSIGGSVGGSYFAQDADYSAGAQPRLWFAGHFRYTFTQHWRAQFTTAFTWSAYDKSEAIPYRDPGFPTDVNKGAMLALVDPEVLQIQYTLSQALWLYYAGVGGGVYRVWVENHREALKDALTYRAHRGLYPGVSGEIGMSHTFREHPSIALEWAVGADWIFTQRDQQFPSGFNSFLLVTHARLGASYHFDVRMAAPKTKPELPQPGR